MKNWQVIEACQFFICMDLGNCLKIASGGQPDAQLATCVQGGGLLP